MDRNKWLDGMMGLIVGDALGVPVQFMEKEGIISRENGPVKGMESGGVYDIACRDMVGRRKHGACHS